MADPSISVVIPVYNGEKYLRECLQSVLEQTPRPAEIIVVDDGSTDNTAGIARTWGAPVKLLSQEQSGPAAARNRGVEAASGEYLAFIDADDLWAPGKLALQVACLKADPAPDLVFGMIRHFYSPETDEEFRGRYACPQELQPGIHPGAMLLKKETFLRVGGFDATLKMGEFIEWRARAQGMGCSARVLPDLVMLRRIHPQNYGITNRAHRKDYLSIVRALMEKKREGA